jgi:outer membrane protein assembly factor BamD
MKGRLIYAILGIMLFSSCSEYQLILKSGNRQEKFDYAMRMYEKKKYSRAVGVLEELYTTSRGDINAENIHYYFAKSYYGAGDFLLSSYFFEDFIYKFPNSKYIEDAAYYNAMCYYKDSPDNPLDQTSTYKAIAQMQYFVDRYPQSTLVEQCNKRIDELREKLESKAYRVAYQYYRMEYYQASVVAFTLLLKDFPDSDRRSKCSFYIIKSSFVLAINSVRVKKEERLAAVSKNFDKFASGIKDAGDLKEVTQLNERAKVLYQEAVDLRLAQEKAAKENKDVDVIKGKNKKVKINKEDKTLNN